MKQSPKHLCQSCHCSIEANEHFCSVCGQKKITQPATFKELYQEAFSNVFSIDSKLTRTLFPLFFQPGKLTNEYLAGKRNLYYTPIKLFLFWMTLAFILLNSLITNYTDKSQDLDRNISVHVKTNNDSLQEKLNLVFVDSLSQQKIATVFDSAKYTKVDADEGFLGILDLKIDRQDLYLLSFEELVKKYDIKSYWEQQLLFQLSKAITQPDDFQFYLFSHLSWLILFSIPLIIVFLKLLYIRQKKYYVEHAIFVFHYHSFVFVCFSILFAWLLWQGKEYDFENSLLLSLLITLIYFIASLRVVYKQSYLKTMLKFFVFSVGYIFILTISILAFLLLTFSMY